MMDLKLLKLKVELLCLGVRLPPESDKGRRYGAGPAGGQYIILPGGSCVNAATWPHYTSRSRWAMEASSRGLYLASGSMRVPVKIVPKPRFYAEKTSDGTPMWKVALLHGVDCLATTVLQSCWYWRHGMQCRFCGIELSFKHGHTILYKKPRQLAEVVQAALEEGVCSHVTLTTGTPASGDMGAELLAEAVKAVKSIDDIPVHVQIEPPSDLRHLDKLMEAETIGVHVETMDSEIFAKVCPGKARRGYEPYYRAWSYCVENWGRGQVSSFLIAGLGESSESLIEGSRKLAELGVIPYIVPLRPIEETPMQHASPPSPEELTRVCVKAAEAMLEENLDPFSNKAGCVRCGACSALLEAYRLARSGA